MSGVVEVDEKDIEHLYLGGKPDREYHLLWKNGAFLFKHKNTIDIAVAIKHVEDAMEKAKEDIYKKSLTKDEV